jgi:thymidylate synthase (FAD)
MQKVLDEGYVTAIESWGSDERIIEAARMSTDKGFLGWGGKCAECNGLGEVLDGCAGMTTCPRCNGSKELPVGDEKLLAYLWNNKHATPFEMAGLIIEVKAPIFVFREWHPPPHSVLQRNVRPLHSPTG